MMLCRLARSPDWAVPVPVPPTIKQPWAGGGGLGGCMECMCNTFGVIEFALESLAQLAATAQIMSTTLPAINKASIDSWHRIPIAHLRSWPAAPFTIPIPIYHIPYPISKNTFMPLSAAK